MADDGDRVGGEASATGNGAGSSKSRAGRRAARGQPKGGSSGLAAVLGVVLPLCTYLFTAQQERMEQSRRKFEQQQQLQLVEDEKDRQQALQIHMAVRDRQFPAGAGSSAAMDSKSICEFLLTELRLQDQGLLGPLALNMVYGIFASPLPNEPGGDPLLCTCREISPSLGDASHSGGHARSDFHARLAGLKCRPEKPPGPAAEVVTPNGPSGGQSSVEASLLEQKKQQRRSDFKGMKPPPRIYIQIGDDTNREVVKCLQHQLTEFGYAVPGIENVGARRAPRQAQLRWFSPNEFKPMMVLSDDLKAAVGACPDGPLRRTIEAMPMPKPESVNRAAGKIRPNHFELWLPPLPAN